jgi:hypothetical protein
VDFRRAAMNLDDVPLNQTALVARELHCRVAATRVTEDVIHLRYFAQMTDDQVLVVNLSKSKPPSINPSDIDPVFWTIRIDGNPATKADLEDAVRRGNVHFEIDPKTLTLSFSKWSPAKAHRSGQSGPIGP